MKPPKERNPDLLVDQTLGFLSRRKGQPVTQEFMDDFFNFFWPRKKKNDLEIMKSMLPQTRQETTSYYQPPTPWSLPSTKN